MRCPTCWILFAAWGSIAIATGARAQDWPQWRGPDRTGTVTTPVDLSAATLQEVWRADIGTGFSSCAVVSGRLYTMGNRDDEDIVWCLDATSGDVLWRHAYPCPLDPNLFDGGPTSTPTLVEDRLYTLSRRGEMICFNASSGAVLWRRNLHDSLGLNIPTWGFSGSPLVVGDRVLVNAGSAGVCVDRHSGNVLWQSDNEEDAGYASPVLVQVGGEELILLVSGKSLNAVALETGEVLWSIRWITRYGINVADPILLADRKLLISSGYGKGTALVEFDASSAETQWRVRELKNQLSPGILLDGRLYAVDGDSGRDPRLVCIEPLSGELLWEDSQFGAGSLIGVNDKLLFLGESGELSLVSPVSNGVEVLLDEQVIDGTCWTPISFADQAMFCRSSTGGVVRLNLLPRNE